MCPEACIQMLEMLVSYWFYKHFLLALNRSWTTQKCLFSIGFTSISSMLGSAGRGVAKCLIPIGFTSISADPSEIRKCLFPITFTSISHGFQAHQCGAGMLVIHRFYKHSTVSSVAGAAGGLAGRRGRRPAGRPAGGRLAGRSPEDRFGARPRGNCL